MNILNRAKSITFKPKDEWTVISQENTPVNVLLLQYLIPLALIPAVASLIGFGLIGYGPVSTLSFGLAKTISSLIMTIGGVLLSAFIIDLLAPSFGAQKNFTKSFALVTYAYTPFLVAGIFYIFPPLAFLALLAGLYSLYVLFLGLKPMTTCPDDKQAVYFIVSLAVIILVSLVLSLIAASVFVGTMVRAASGF
jgi:hypothetical protein